MKASHTLSVTRREKLGSRYAQRYRDAGLLPAVLYGQKRDPVSLNLEAKEALRFFQLGEKVFNIEVKEEGASQTVLLKGLQYDYLGTNVVHVDLERVDLDQEIESSVPIRYVGEAKGSGAAGAIMVHPNTTLTVRCSVANLPDHIDVDVTELGVGDALHVSDLTLPEGLTALDDPGTIVAAIQMTVEEAEGEAVEGGEDDAQPEVITEKKQEEEG